jgi:hypothetical protein
MATVRAVPIDDYFGGQYTSTKARYIDAFHDDDGHSDAATWLFGLV